MVSVIFFPLYILAIITFSINPASSKCNKSFSCGSLGHLEFPLSESIECGFFPVDCTSSPPSVQFTAGGPWWELHEKISANKFRVVDRYLQNLLQQGNCLAFLRPTLPGPPLISFEYSPRITLLSCLKNDSNKMKSLFHNYKSYNICDATDFYYGGPPTYTFPVNTTNTTIFNGCGFIDMPIVKLKHRNDSDDLFKLLSPEFEVEWNVSGDCVSCYNRGGTCLTDNNNEFWCKGARIGRKTVILVSAICAIVALLGSCFAISYLIYRCKKKRRGPYLLSRNVSSGPSFKSDLELTGRFYFGLSVFSYQELEEATGNFDPSRELGDGGFGTIYYGQLRDGREVAIKRLYEHNVRRVEQFMNEINILTFLRHPNLVSLYGCTSRRSQDLLLVYEYIPNGTVADHLHGKISKTSPLVWPVRMSIAIETATALAYLHSSNIIHRDVKTNNILLDKNFSVKVADFGLSKPVPTDVSHVSTSPQGTPGYVDPDYHQCYQLSDKSDVYSFGVVLIELISSMPAVDLTRSKHEINLANYALDRIRKCAFDELIDSSLGYKSNGEVERMTKMVAEVAFRCMQVEKEWRPSMDEVLKNLKDIEAGEDYNLQGRSKRGSGKIITNPETNGNSDSSPVTVIDTWPSVTSTTKSSTTWIC